MGEDRAEAERFLAKCEAILATWEADGASTPTTLKRVAAALLGKAWALFNLDRTEESLDWVERLLAFYAIHQHDGLSEQWLADGLRAKRAALSRLNRREEAAATCAESIIRFRHGEDPDLRLRAAEALSARSWFLLTDPARFAQGMALSDELLEMVGQEPADSRLAIAEVAAIHMRLLTNAHDESLLGITGFVAGVAASNVATASEALALSLLKRAGARAPALPGLRGTVARLTPASLTRAHARARQALKVASGTLLALEELPDVEVSELRSRIELSATLCRMSLGQGAAAVKGLDTISKRPDPSVARAYQNMLDDTGARHSAIGQLGTAGLLAGRAQALGGDDPEIVRIAYDDAIAASLPARQPWPLRWLLRRLAPGR